MSPGFRLQSSLLLPILSFDGNSCAQKESSPGGFKFFLRGSRAVIKIVA